jgi:hypothetical protein
MLISICKEDSRSTECPGVERPDVGVNGSYTEEEPEKELVVEEGHDGI